MTRCTKPAAAILAAAVVATIAGCAPGAGGDGDGPGAGGDGDGPVTIEFMHRWPDPGRSEYFEGIVDRFNESQDHIRVESSSVASEPYKQQIQVLASQGELPDVYFSLPGEFAQRFVRGGMAADLSDYLDGTEWGESFTPMTLGGYQFDGAYYGVPATMNLAGIVYNTQMFADAGVEEPQTVEDLLAVCDVFREQGTLPVAFGNKDIWPAGHIPTVLNAAYVDSETREKDYADPQEGSFTDPGYLKSFEMSLEIKERCMAESVNGQTLDPVWAQWGSGDAAMAFMTMGNYSNIRDAAEVGTVGENWATLPWPPAEDGIADQNSMTGAPDGFLVNEASEHKEEALEFLKFLTSMDNAQRMSDESGLISTVEGANKDLAPQQQTLLDAASEAGELNIWLDTVLPSDVGDVYMTGMQALFGGEATPDELFEQLQQAAATWQ